MHWLDNLKRQFGKSKGERIILKWNLQEQVVKAWTGHEWL
jgi:hypothetical protein